MKNEKFVIILLGIMTVASLFLAFEIIQYKSKYERAVFFNDKHKNEFTKWSHKRSCEYLTNGIYLKNIKLINQQNETVLLSDIIDKNALIFCFTELCCVECFENYISILNTIHDSNNCFNIILLTNYENSKILKVKVNNYNVEYKAFIIEEEIELPINYKVKNDIHDVPYFLVTNKDLLIVNSMIGEPLDSIDNPFFESAIRFLKDETKTCP